MLWTQVLPATKRTLGAVNVVIKFWNSDCKRGDPGDGVPPVVTAAAPSFPHGRPATQAELLLLQGTVLGPYLTCGQTSVAQCKNCFRCALGSHCVGF